MGCSTEFQNPAYGTTYLIAQQANRITTYRITESVADGNGALTEASDVTVSLSDGSSIAIHPSRPLFYVSEFAAGKIHVFSIDRTTGAVTLLQTTRTTGETPSQITFDPTRNLLMYAATSSGRVGYFDVQSDGTLGPVRQNMANAAGDILHSPAFGDLLLATRAALGFHAYSISEIVAGTSTPLAVTGSSIGCHFTADPNGIYVITMGLFLTTADVFEISGGGTPFAGNFRLTQTIGAAHNLPAAAAQPFFHPGGHTVYIANSSSIARFAFDTALGQLGHVATTSTSTIAGTNRNTLYAFDHSWRTLYLAAGTGGINIFPLDSETHALGTPTLQAVPGGTVQNIGVIRVVRPSH